MQGMERTSEKVARLVWFCGAARVAFLRATGSLSVQVRLNVDASFTLFGLPWVDGATPIGMSSVFVETLLRRRRCLYLDVIARREE